MKGEGDREERASPEQTLERPINARIQAGRVKQATEKHTPGTC